MEVANRNELEASFARRFQRLSGRHRRELKELMGSPPDLNKVTQDFWDRVKRETEEVLLIILLLIFVTSATQHGMARKDAQSTGLKWSARRSAKVSTGYVKHSREELARIGGGWEFPSARSAEEDLKRIFGPERSGRVAATETTDAATSGSEAGVKATVGFSEDDTWFTRSDGKVCEICQPLHNKPRSVWSRKFPDGPGADVHPDCRCWIQYALEKAR